MTVITKSLPAMSESYIGLLSFGKEIGSDAATMGVGHPDNYIMRSLVGLEIVATVCSLFDIRVTNRALAKLGDVFITNHTQDSAQLNVFAKIAESIDASFEAMTPEDDFDTEMYKPAQIKRAITSTRNTIAKLFEANGHLVVMHAIYVAAGEQTEPDVNPLAFFVEATLDKEHSEASYTPSEMLAAVKKVHTRLKAWDKKAVQFAKTLDFVELEIADS